MSLQVRLLTAKCKYMQYIKSVFHAVYGHQDFGINWVSYLSVKYCYRPDWKLSAVKLCLAYHFDKATCDLFGEKQEFSALICAWSQTQWICFRGCFWVFFFVWFWFFCCCCWCFFFLKCGPKPKQIFTEKHSGWRNEVLCMTKYYSTWEESRHPSNGMHPKISCGHIKITKA